ncbi:hypothetical protein F5B20DRAFT_74528 [Whalleya microplaca]|nr:hypothetical protein F5B20DRAFT_74528 [Whalleya microplaca]
MAAAERRKQEQNQMRNGPGPSAPSGVLPSIQQHHHHMGLPGPQPPLPSHNTGRPSLDRAHTFPTPPTSASSVMGSMGASENFQWSQQGMSSGQGNNPMSIDTGLSNTAPRSMPATPASTPPGSSLQSMPSYPQGNQSYDSSRGVYNGPAAQQSPYPPSHSSPQDRGIYGQPGSYMKSEMGPPSGRPAGGPTEQSDVKPSNGMMQHGDGVPHANGEEEAEHEAEYTHDSGAYDANRTAYNNYNAPPVAPLASDHHNLSPEMTGSPSHQAGSGRATPRTAAPPQPYYAQQAGYSTPPRVQPPSSLYNVIGNDRGPTNGAPAPDVYNSQSDIGAPMPNGYASQSVMNGAAGPLKRGRDDEDDLNRPSSGGLDLKRRKTMIDGPMPAPGYDTMNRPASAVARRR